MRLQRISFGRSDIPPSGKGDDCRRGLASGTSTMYVMANVALDGSLTASSPATAVAWRPISLHRIIVGPWRFAR
jgi:hypothetical protein